MTPSLRILPAADHDQDEQAEYLATAAGLETASRFYDSVALTFETIARMPGIGEPWKSSRPRLACLRTCRIQKFASPFVFHRVMEGSIEIVRVWHGSRDLEVALGSIPS